MAHRIDKTHALRLIKHKTRPADLRPKAFLVRPPILGNSYRPANQYR